MEDIDVEKLRNAVEKAKATSSRILDSLRLKGISLVSGNSGLKRSTLSSADTSDHLKETLLEAQKSGTSSLLKMGKTGDFSFTKNVDINDCKNRYHLTMRSTQEQISKDSDGALIVTRGRYYPDPQSMATDLHPPLYLHVAAPTQESLDAAIAAIDKIIATSYVFGSSDGAGTGSNAIASNGSQGNNNLNQQHYQQQQPQHQQQQQQQQQQQLTEKVPVGIDSERLFTVRGKILGTGGGHVKFIQSQSGCRVQLRGIGSDFRDPSTGQEANEPLHIFIQGASEMAVANAKKLAQELIAQVKNDFDMQRMQRMEHQKQFQGQGQGQGQFQGQGQGQGQYQGQGQGQGQFQSQGQGQGQGQYQGQGHAAPGTNQYNSNYHHHYNQSYNQSYNANQYYDYNQYYSAMTSTTGNGNYPMSTATPTITDPNDYYAAYYNSYYNTGGGGAGDSTTYADPSTAHYYEQQASYYAASQPVPEASTAAPLPLGESYNSSSQIASGLGDTADSSGKDYSRVRPPASLLKKP